MMRGAMLASAVLFGVGGPAMAGATILKGATVCRSFESAKAMQWADAKGTAALIRSGKCYKARGDAPTISAESGPDIVEFRTADNPGVAKYALIEDVRFDAPPKRAAPVAPVIATPTPDPAEPDPLKIYESALNRFCPRRRLDWLNPGIIEAGFDSYMKNQTQDTRADILRRARSDLDKCEVGAQCGNDAYVRAISARSELAALTQHLCRTVKYTCVAPYDCAVD